MVAPYIRDDLSITNEGYGYAVGSFLAAYTVMHLVSGRIVDAVGTRIGFALAVAWWSVAAMLHGATRGVWSLCAFRFLLGAGEAGGYPAAIKCVGEWFRSSERALATGLFNTGAAFGAIVAPPLVVWLVLRAGWRATFFFTGSAGLLWVFAWLLIYKRPPETGAIRAKTLARMDLRRLITLRPIWGLSLARFLSDPVWYFYLFWLPTYLKDIRHFSLAEAGYFAWIPFLTADLGSLAGGAASSWLIRHGCPLFRARHIAMMGSALLMPAALFVTRAEHPAAAVAWISLATFGHQSWSSNSLTPAGRPVSSPERGLGLRADGRLWIFGGQPDLVRSRPCDRACILRPRVCCCRPAASTGSADCDPHGEEADLGSRAVVTGAGCILDAGEKHESM